MANEGYVVSRMRAEDSRQRKQPSTLHFVNVAVTPLRAHFPVRDVKDERSIRAHVMKDYLQQKLKPSKPRDTPHAVPKLSDHLTQFRLSVPGGKKRSGPAAKKARSEEHAPRSVAAPLKMRPIIPKDAQNLHETVLARPLADDVLFNIPSPISTSTPGTSALLEYYHTSYWDNSVAVNPEGKWISVAISDAAMLHATLCLVALHKFQTRGEPLANSYFWHRGEAMRLIARNLADPEQATSDATVGAVAVLSASDNSMHWPSITQASHIEGMITLVRLRGGIDGMNTNRHIRRVVVWADILHATAHNSTPQLEVAQPAAPQEMKRLVDIVEQHSQLLTVEQGIVPAEYQNVLEDLRALAMAKALLIRKAVSKVQELRLMFCNLLFVIEHRILELGHTVASSLSVMGDITGAEAVKAAALIFTIHGLRDLAITAAFYDSLVRRLRDGLSDIFNGVFQGQNRADVSDETISAPFLLWLCLNGWQASATKTRQTDREFFVEKAALLCESVSIDSLEELEIHMDRIVYLPEYHLAACSGLWADIKSWTVLRNTEWTLT